MRDSSSPERNSTHPAPHDCGTAEVAGQPLPANLYYWSDLRRRRPDRYVVAFDEGIAAIHAGPTVDLARVIAFEATPAGENPGMTERDPDYDLCVFDPDGRCRAIITRSHKGDRVRMLDDGGTER